MPEPRKKSPLLACLLIPLVAVVMLVVTGVVGFMLWRSSTARKTAAHLETFRAAGYPTTPEELDTFYALGSGESDVTKFWLDALAPLGTAAFRNQSQGISIIGGSSNIPPLGQNWTELPRVQQLLSQYENSLELMRRASAEGPRARYAVDFHSGFDFQLPHLTQIRDGARILILESHARAHAGDLTGAVESLETTLRLSRSLEEEPVLKSQLVRMACSNMALQRIVELAQQAELPDAELARLQRVVRESDYRHATRRALACERVLALNNLPPVALSWSADPQIEFSNTMQVVMEALEVSWAAAMKEVDADPGSGLFAMASPAWRSTLVGGARQEAYRNVADVFLAVQRYRLQHGEVPTSLELLVPDFLPAQPLDPFNDEVLTYRVDEASLMIYSVGDNKQDDAGKVGDFTAPDVGVKLPLSPAAVEPSTE